MLLDLCAHGSVQPEHTGGKFVFNHCQSKDIEKIGKVLQEPESITIFEEYDKRESLFPGQSPTAPTIAFHSFKVANFHVHPVTVGVFLLKIRMGDGFKTALAFLIVLVLIVGAISLVKKKPS
ncbi:MAG: hypothetical protein II421_03575, partial [Bacteroidales bacterium]|nr:hypothetical protein [Bacteroidales bacterium]